MFSLQVELIAKFSETRAAKITFSSLRENGVAGSMMVFRLTSNICSRIPYNTLRKSCTLFEYRTLPIEIVNPFDKGGSFIIKLDISFIPLNVEDLIRPDEKKAKSNGAHILRKLAHSDFGDEDADIENLFRKPFWVTEEKILLEPNASRTVTLHFLPFLVGQHTCQVVASDSKAGEVPFSSS